MLTSFGIIPKHNVLIKPCFVIVCFDLHCARLLIDIRLMSTLTICQQYLDPNWQWLRCLMYVFKIQTIFKKQQKWFLQKISLHIELRLVILSVNSLFVHIQDNVILMDKINWKTQTTTKNILNHHISYKLIHSVSKRLPSKHTQILTHKRASAFVSFMAWRRTSTMDKFHLCVCPLLLSCNWEIVSVRWYAKSNEKTKYHTVGKVVLNVNRNIVERGQIDTPSTNIWLSWYRYFNKKRCLG